LEQTIDPAEDADAKAELKRILLVRIANLEAIEALKTAAKETAKPSESAKSSESPKLSESAKPLPSPIEGIPLPTLTEALSPNEPPSESRNQPPQIPQPDREG